MIAKMFFYTAQREKMEEHFMSKQRGILIFVFLILLMSTATFGADNLVDAAATHDPIKAKAAAATLPADGPDMQFVGGLTYYTDRPTFDGATGGLPVYDFENATSIPGNFQTCSTPVDSSTSDACFSPGDIPAGISFATQTTGIDLLVMPGGGFFGSTSQNLITNTFADHMEITFSPPVNAAGMDLVSYLAGANLAITVYDETLSVVGNTNGNATNAEGSFWGVSTGGLIGRIDLLSAGEAEGVDNISFGTTGPSLVMTDNTSVDQCADPAGNTNGLIEPGEAVFFDAELSAINGNFSGISCVLSSSTPGVIIVQNASTYPNLNDGNSAYNNTQFSLELSTDTGVCFGNLDLALNCTSNEGNFAYAVSEPIGSALESDQNVAIPDNNPGGATSSLVIADDVTITDANVRVQIDHTWVGDIYIELQPPAGPAIVLLDRPGVPASGAGCADDNMDVTFDDGAGGDLENLCAGNLPWFVGSADPVGSLAGLNGSSSAGTWNLFVTDNAGADTGQIVSWELITTPAIGGSCEVCNDNGLGPVVSIIEVPTLDFIGLMLLMLALAGFSVVILRR